MDDEEEYQFTVEYQAATYQGRRTFWATGHDSSSEVPGNEGGGTHGA